MHRISFFSSVLVFMAVQADCSNFTGAVFPRIVPNRLQFFEYESVSVHCEVDNNITEWKVKWKSHKIKNASYTSTSPCIIYPSFESHSGEYWCETEDGIKSEALNITITAGSVILETPTHPVKEGNEVTLNCKNKTTQSEHITNFYKDGVSLGTWNQSSMNIKNVSKSDEGLYKCSIDGAGESPESWLAVIKQHHHQAPYNKTDLSHEVPKISHDEVPKIPHDKLPKNHILLWIVICAVLVALLLVVIVLVLHMKHKVRQDTTDLHQAKYDVGREERKQKYGDNSDLPDDVLYVTIKNHWKKKETKLSRADMNPCCQEETVIYSSVK